MSSMDTIILDLLEKSSLPGIYKVIIRNLLSQMTGEQKDSILKILFADQNNIKEIERQKMALYRKYAPVIDSVLADPGSAKFNPMILNFSKEKKQETNTEKVGLKLGALKNSVEEAVAKV